MSTRRVPEWWDLCMASDKPIWEFRHDMLEGMIATLPASTDLRKLLKWEYEPFIENRKILANRVTQLRPSAVVDHGATAIACISSSSSPAHPIPINNSPHTSPPPTPMPSPLPLSSSSPMTGVVTTVAMGPTLPLHSFASKPSVSSPLLRRRMSLTVSNIVSVKKSAKTFVVQKSKEIFNAAAHSDIVEVPTLLKEKSCNSALVSCADIFDFSNQRLSRPSEKPPWHNTSLCIST